MVAADEAVANEAVSKAKNIKEDCESDLAEAIPALESALAALDTLKPSDITLVKTMKVCKPPINSNTVLTNYQTTQLNRYLFSLPLTESTFSSKGSNGGSVYHEVY